MRNVRLFTGPLLLAAVLALVVPAALARQQPGNNSRLSSVGAQSAIARGNGAVTRQQMEDVQSRIDTAIAIVNRLEPEAKARGLADGWRQPALESLLLLSAKALRQVEGQAFSLDALSVAAAEAGDDPNLIGDPNRDLTYTPIAPCRFVDTRFYAAGKINGNRGFDLALTGASYGGSAGCNPTALFAAGENQFGALAINVTVNDTSTAGSPGFLAAKPRADSPVTSLLNWFQSAVGVQVANMGIVTTDQTGDANEFFIQTSGAVHVIVDIFGAFIEPQATALQIVSVAGANAAIGANANVNLPAANCPAGYSVTGGGADVDSFAVHLVESRQAGNGWVCAVQNTGGASAGNCTATCARVPGR